MVYTFEHLGSIEMQFHDRPIRTAGCGRIGTGRRKINLSTAFAGQTAGVREVEDQTCLASSWTMTRETSLMTGAGGTHPNPSLPDKVETM
jgi:putative transposase